MTENKQQNAVPQQRIACKPDEGFCALLPNLGGSIAVTTYQAGVVVLIGLTGNRPLILPRHFDKPMGLDISGDQLILATRNSITRFRNDTLLAHNYNPDQPGHYDALYLPRASYFTTDLHIHDIALTDKDEVWLVNTRFSCLAKLSHQHSFNPRWKPAFISALAPEDRCHLNGLALRDNQPAWVTALGEADDVGGWRELKANGGIVMDVQKNEVIARGLAMPHSPRWYDNKLWLLNSGAGQLLEVDPRSGQTSIVCELQGYLRGLAFSEAYALVGLSKIRESNIFGGMPIQEKHASLKCGIAIVDLNRGAQVGFLEFTTGCSELYDVRVLKGVSRPNILNLDKEATWQAVSAPAFSYWLRPENTVEN